MKTKVIKLSRPYIPHESLDLALRSISSGNLVQGEYVLKLEKDLSTYLNVDHVVLVSNGTAALHLALTSLNISIGDEVIVPAFSFPAVSNAVELIGATPIFVDITLDDLCMDVSKIEDAITKNTKAIMPVHEFGQSANMAVINEIALKHDLFVIEDAACALGTKFNHQHAGTFGDLGCFSFHPRKILTTGEGGAVVTNDEKLADKLRKLRNHGIDYSSGKLDFVLPGFNYRLTDFQAAMGIDQLTCLDETIGIHRNQATIYDQNFKNLNTIKTVATFDNRYQTFQTYHIILESETKRDKLKNDLLQKGIETNFGANSIPLLSFYKGKYQFGETDFIKANIAYQNGLALPIGRHLEEEDIWYIIASVKEILSHGI